MRGDFYLSVTICAASCGPVRRFYTNIPNLPTLAIKAFICLICSILSSDSSLLYACSCIPLGRGGAISSVSQGANPVILKNPAQERPLLSTDGYTINGLLACFENLALSHAGADQLHKKVIRVCNIAQRLGSGAYLNPKHGHSFTELEPVADVTAAAGDIVYHNSIEFVPVGSGEQRLKARACRR